jgi:tetratricopeptide (TPR) repeat protein
MKKHRAFVGHSFTPEDKDVVGKFLDYLNAIQEMNPDFGWEHAEHPEPEAIDNKVLRLFQDKNIFIGICTRKEKVIKPSGLKKAFFSARVSAEEKEFTWKTSDWVIQEIGLALGREMKVILLLEEGVRAPGGIQGSLEYIPFSRENPQTSFGKLLQMIASLSPMTVQITGAESSATTEAVEIQDQDIADQWPIPDHTWGAEKYKHAYMHMMVISDASGAQKIENSFLQSSIATGVEKISWAAFVEYARILFGKDGTLENLRQLSEKHKENVSVLRYLALSYKSLGEDEKTAETFVKAVSVESSAIGKMDLLGSAIESIAKKNPRQAEILLDQAKEVAFEDASLNQKILSIENSFSKLRKEDGFMFAAMERFLEAEPDNYSKRFDLAYAYGEAKIHDMSMFHYQRIPPAARSDAVWNNLGVCYENQSLPVSSIHSYKRSKDLGSTLAMSNLAYRLVNAGFLEEAREVCAEAMQIDDHHKNVDSALAKLKDVQDTENETNNKLISFAQSVSDFYREVGVALLVPHLHDFDEEWVFEGARLRTVLSDREFSATGTVEESAASIRLAGTDSKPDVYDITFKGRSRGAAIQGSYEKKRKGGTIMTFFSPEKSEEVMMYFSADRASIEILMGRGEKQKRLRMLRSSALIHEAMITEQKTA